MKCVCCKTVFFLRPKVKTWLGTEVPITVSSNNRVEWRHTSQNKKESSWQAQCVWMCVCGRGELLVLFGCLFTAEDGSRACKKDGETSQQTNRQAGRQAGRISVWWSVYLLSPPQQAQWHYICSGCTILEKTSQQYEIGVSWEIVEQNAYFLINRGCLSLSVQDDGLKRTSLLCQAFTARVELDRCPANGSGNLLKSF